MVCHNRLYVRCYNSTTYNALYHGLLQQQKLAMSHAIVLLYDASWYDIPYHDTIPVAMTYYLRKHSMLRHTASCSKIICYDIVSNVQCQNIQIFNFILGRVTWHCGAITSTNCTLSVFCFTEYNSTITQNNTFNENSKAVSFTGGGNRRTPKSQQLVASHRQTLSHNVVHLSLIEISGYRHWFT
jgi:hypothetical protein